VVGILHMLSEMCLFPYTTGTLISRYGVHTSMLILGLAALLAFTSTISGMKFSNQSEPLFIRSTDLDSSCGRFAGWWGHDPVTRFQMPPKFSPIVGAQGFQQSNPCIIACASLLGSLQVFKEAGMMAPLRERSVSLTVLLEKLLSESKYFVPSSSLGKEDLENPNLKSCFTIITPQDPKQRGAQLSLLFLPVGSGLMRKVFHALVTFGVIGDEREPDVIRLAPAPLYNDENDCKQAARSLEIAFQEILG